jgi:tetratricopeptide (TPR) repeat protein
MMWARLNGTLSLIVVMFCAHATGVGIALLETTPIQAQPASSGKDQRLRSSMDAQGFDKLRYKTTHALVVGIDYQSLNTPLLGKLNNAVNDADSIHKILVKYFGYTDDHITFLKGENATKHAITDVFDKWSYSTSVGPDDSVLFYFSGHGFLGEKDQKLYLIPDNLTLEGEKPDLSSCIDVQSCMNDINQRCPAKHKLFILDCCYSGMAASQLLDNVAEEQVFSVVANDAYLDNPCFQVLTACLQSQTSSDGKVNSPFTSALMNALEQIPSSLSRKNDYRFSVNRVFKEMDIHRETNLHQKFFLRSLSGTGQFHFFPDSKVEFPEKIDSYVERRMLMAMAPSASGKWWMEESPWFIPGLRYEIANYLPTTRGHLNRTNIEELEQAADEFSRNQTSKGDLLRKRITWMKRLRSARSQKDRQEAVKELRKELATHLVAYETAAPDAKDEVAEVNASDAPELHLCAVLSHYDKIDSLADIDRRYQLAIRAYRDGSQQYQTYRYLLPLCRVDYALFLSNKAGKFIEATKEFEEALRSFGEAAPPEFQIYALMEQSLAYSKAGMWGWSERTMNAVVEKLEQHYPSTNPSLFAASIKNRKAWNSMVSWDFNDAEKTFADTDLVLTRILEQNDLQAYIDHFHVLHGRAMLQRYRGDSHASLRMYRELTSNIFKKADEFDKSTNVSNYTELRNMLALRLVNSIERQADCHMFSADCDYAEAADDYRIAIREGDGLSTNEQPAMLFKLMCKRALALILDTTGDHEANMRTAKALFMEAKVIAGYPANFRFTTNQQLENESSIKSALGGTTRTLVENSTSNMTDVGEINSKLYAPIIECMLDAGTMSDPCLDTMRSCIQSYWADKKLSRIIPRDDLEGLMFFTRHVIINSLDKLEHLPDEQQDQMHNELNNDLSLLLTFCRSPQRMGQKTTETLRYLRPYYDVALKATMANSPEHIKEMIEICWEATHIDRYQKPDRNIPVLAIYYDGVETHFLLDIPRHTGRHFVSKDYSKQQLMNACKQGELLYLPDELAVQLQKIARESQNAGTMEPQINLIWTDSVMNIVHTPPIQVTAMKPPLDQVADTELDPGMHSPEEQKVIPESNYTLFDIHPLRIWQPALKSTVNTKSE